MKKIYASADIGIIKFYQSILENNQIKTLIKNYYLTGAKGDIPFEECVPELWIFEDEKWEEAKTLLKVEKNTPWKCVCGEHIDGQFAQCWKCGEVRGE